jgi:hypothetical protein
MLVDTIVLLWDNPGSVEDTSNELQRIVLRSYSLSEHQNIVKWLDFPDLPALTDQCNEIWESRSQDLAAVAAAAVIPRQHSQTRQPPDVHAHPRPRQPRQRLLFLPRPLRLPRQEVQERLHNAHTRKRSRLAVVARTASAGPTYPC